MSYYVRKWFYWKLDPWTAEPIPRPLDRRPKTYKHPDKYYPWILTTTPAYDINPMWYINMYEDFPQIRIFIRNYYTNHTQKSSTMSPEAKFDSSWTRASMKRYYWWPAHTNINIHDLRLFIKRKPVGYAPVDAIYPRPETQRSHNLFLPHEAQTIYSSNNPAYDPDYDRFIPYYMFAKEFKAIMIDYLEQHFDPDVVKRYMLK